MTLDLGWQGMQSKFWVGLLSFAGLALVAVAQDEGTGPLTNKAETTQAATSSDGADPVSEGDTGTAETALDSITDPVVNSVNGTPTEASDLTLEEAASSATVDDNYTPTERISEDRSVSFPIDI